MTTKIILLRHAEKPSADGTVGGVDASGRPNDDDLSVRGWQRAGALARFFAPGGGSLGVPRALYASRPTAEHPSRRAVSTLQPLARWLGLPLNQSFTCGQEPALTQALATDEGVTLVAWDHRGLCRIAQALVGAAAPDHWPAGCFDRYWIFSRDADGWRLAPQPQQLLDGDD
ncbi:hypothetical protein [Pelomonas cellulosilytica]|uniref:Phosphoglycerate mutase n=1 Tax=Pelomonas cellulosilytica TaxID=2906762 RepID=A0ABS8XW88_9BURK|nr:hypothetical protein [Pelomonas sp. P8]MCE4556057.1 hypothetical protein [Pelomonas sp. P8]